MNNFSSNVKFLREQNKLSQNKLAELANVNQTTIARWENGEISPSLDNLIDLADALNVHIADLVGSDLSFDNAEYIDVFSDIVMIPVLGTIKAGTPIEAQENVLEYVDIPKDWTKGGKQFYGLKISGDSMYPEYKENDIVIFEKTEDYARANKKDCAVMVNGDDATFKNVTISSDGITLVPLNLNNSDEYKPTFYNKEDILNKPVKIIGIVKETRRRKE